MTFYIDTRTPPEIIEALVREYPEPHDCPDCGEVMIIYRPETSPDADVERGIMIAAHGEMCPRRAFMERDPDGRDWPSREQWLRILGPVGERHISEWVDPE